MNENSLLVLARLPNRQFRQQRRADFLHLHLSINRGCWWGTTDDSQPVSSISFLFSTAPWDLPNSRPVHFLTLSSHLFFCLPCLLPPFTVPLQNGFWPDVMYGRHVHTTSVCVFTIVRRSSCGPVACCILAQTSSLVKRSWYEMRGILL